MEIDIVQYMRPDGRQVKGFMDIPDNLGQKYIALVDSGCNVAAELLMTGQVSFTIEDPVVEDDFRIELVENGPKVPAALARLVDSFDAQELVTFRAQRQANSRW